MADIKDWTEADDAQLRRAMATLRADVDATPLPDVSSVKARGMQRRRQRMLTWTAAAASAAVVVGAVGFAQLGRDTTQRPFEPATQTSPTSAAPTPTTSATGSDSLLPVAAEWESALGMPVGSVTVTPVTKGGGVECGPAFGRATQQDEVHQDSSPVTGGGAYWKVSGDMAAAVSATTTAVASCENGPGFVVTKASTTALPVYSYATPDAGSGWFAVVQGRSGVALLQLSDPAANDVKSGGFTQDHLVALAKAAQARMNGSTQSPSSPSATTSTAGPTVKAINEKMSVHGVEPLISSDLFVAASQWTSPFFGGGARAKAGPADTAPTIGAIGIPCETSDFLSGEAGRFGIVQVRAGAGEANVVGRQRVRLYEDVQGYELVQADMARLGEVFMTGCTVGGDRTTAEAGPVPGSYLLTTKVTVEATGTQYRWVGVTGMQTEGAISTVVFEGTDDGQGFQGTKDEGFAELVRLMDLARQK